MSDHVQNGVDQPTDSQKADKYAAYRTPESNQPMDLGGSSGAIDSEPEKVVDAKPVESPKPETVAQSSSTKQQPGESNSGYDRRIRSLTKQLRTTQEELAEIRASTEKKPAGPELKRENFLTEDEWDDHRANKRVDAILEKRRLEEREQSQKQEIAKNEDDGFRKSWAEKVQRTMSADDIEALSLLSETYNGEQFSQHIHDVVTHSEMGPRIVYELLKSPDIVVELNRMPAIVAAQRLLEVEKYLKRIDSAKKSKQTASAAPAPIGQVGGLGGHVSGTRSTEDEAFAYNKRKYGAR